MKILSFATHSRSFETPYARRWSGWSMLEVHGTGRLHSFLLDLS